ncbi:MAG TPA: nuclear transport factor 2 family protein [Burkholderiaceae bacterium]|nr:nuclear transport factor 2 family protein [Burkholderiaceae bacterium]
MMDIEGFMQAYKRAWETSDEELLASLFAPDGVYRNTPFSEQRGHGAIKAYWQRTKLQSDIALRYEILARHEHGGVAHWRTTYQVTSEELFALWAASTGTNLLARKPGDPLPRLALDGIAVVHFDASGRCRELSLWWHSRIDSP